MVVEIFYDNLPETIKDILVEGDVACNNVIRIKDKLILALLYDELIPDRGVEMVRITNEDDYERLIDIKDRMEENSQLFFENVINGYKDLALSYPEKYLF